MKRIEEYRLQKGWSLYKLASESGISQSLLSNMYARGTLPSLTTLFNICEALGISVSTFFQESDEASDLTDDEKALLADFRRLSADNKALLLRLASTIK